MRRHIIAVVLGLALIGACGGDDDTSTAAESADPGTSSSTTEAVAEAEEHVVSIWTSLELPPSGDKAAVTEVIEYEFAGDESHGIYREIDDLDPEADITVSSPTAPVDVVVTETEFGAGIEIGDPAETITGVHSYTITYPLLIDDRRPLVWDAVGTAWSVPIDAVEVHITGPAEWVETRCITGPDDAVESCDSFDQGEPGHLVAVQSALDPGMGVTVEALRGEPLGAVPDAPAPPG